MIRMNIKDLSTQLLYTTVPILVKREGNELSTGTGFIFSVLEEDNSSIPMLITNYHVLQDAELGYFELHIAENGAPTNNTIRISFDKNIINNNKLGDLDLIAIPLATTFNNLTSSNISLFYRTIDQNMIPTQEQVKDFSSIEDVCFVGYPSGLYDEINKLPVIRQGITATPIWNNFKGHPIFLIDGGVFPGSSGSPVFIYNRCSYPTKNSIVIGTRLHFIGVISETLLRNEDKSKAYLNLGCVINSNDMYAELTKLISKLKNK